jgi:hypothetical protein
MLLSGFCLPRDQEIAELLQSIFGVFQDAEKRLRECLKNLNGSR